MFWTCKYNNLQEETRALEIKQLPREIVTARQLLGCLCDKRMWGTPTGDLTSFGKEKVSLTFTDVLVFQRPIKTLIGRVGEIMNVAWSLTVREAQRCGAASRLPASESVCLSVCLSVSQSVCLPLGMHPQHEGGKKLIKIMIADFTSNTLPLWKKKTELSNRHIFKWHLAVARGYH